MKILCRNALLAACIVPVASMMLSHEGDAACPSFLSGKYFSAGTNPNGGVYPQAVAVGDFNEDGKLDVIVANDYTNEFALLLGDGTGGFAPPVLFSTTLHPQSILVADFNRDGHLDVAIASNFISVVSIHLGTGQGGFGSAANFAVSGPSKSLVAADLNGDGLSDLAVVGSSSFVSILLGNGLGGFAPQVNIPVAGSSRILAADFNGDQKVDLALLSGVGGSPGWIYILTGNGSGGFSVTGSFSVLYAPTDMTIADFDGNGTLDIVVTYRSEPYSIGLWLGDGAGTFSYGGQYLLESGTGMPFSVTVANLNGDTLPDVLVGSFTYTSTTDGITSATYLTSFLGNAAGRFSMNSIGTEGGPAPWTSGYPYGIAAGDFNQDGKTDAVLTDLGRGIWVFLNDTTPYPCQAFPVPAGIAEDAYASEDTSSDMNSVLEPGETVLLTTRWKNVFAGPVSLTGTASNFGGPAGAVYTLLDATAGYGTIPPGGYGDSHRFGPSYRVSVSNPPIRPAHHWDVTLDETISAGLLKTWTLHVGKSFTDVPVSDGSYCFVEILLHNLITAGCGGGNYCPASAVTRWQMAVFLATAMVGPTGTVPTTGTVPNVGGYNCTPGGVSLFYDVPPTDGGCKFIHYIYAQGITGGCGDGNYCPASNITRWQMAVFLTMAMVGPAGFVPTSGTVPNVGSYNCDSGGISLFGDIPPTDWGCKYIHYIYAGGVTAGCGGGNYCPASNVTRWQMAPFLVTAFQIPLLY